MFGALGVIVHHTSAARHDVSVVGSTNPSASGLLAQPLRTAPIGALNVSPDGPYRAGQSVRIAYKLRARARPPLAQPPVLNPGVSVCYPWGSGETCDPAIQSRDVRDAPAGTVTNDLSVPGWVYTPTGLQSCGVLHCRFEVETDGADTRIGTPPLDIVPGPEPHIPAAIIAVHHDALIDVSLDIHADPSWTRWSATADRAAITEFPPGAISVCAFGAQVLCDTLIPHSPPPFDGHPHMLTVPTNRLLLTSAGWIDCEKVVCALTITRAVDVEVGPWNHGLGGLQGQTIVGELERGSRGPVVRANIETIAVLPYQLSSTTPDMQQPTLTVTSAGPIHLGDTITAILHNPPPNVPDSQLLLWRCSGISLHDANPCNGAEPPTWTKSPDGSLREQEPVKLPGADLKYGIYLALVVPTRSDQARDYIDQPGTAFVGYGTRVAQTGTFTVTPPPRTGNG
jgi:hypothetical protein